MCQRTTYRSKRYIIKPFISWKKYAKNAAIYNCAKISSMKIIDATDQKKWDKFVTSHDEANFLQSWAWGEFHESRGKTVVRRIAVDDKNKIQAAYVGQVETAKRGTYMAIAGGPILDWSNKKLVKEIFKDIKEQGEEMPSEILEAPEVDAKTQLYTLTIKYKIAKQMTKLWDRAGVAPKYQAVGLNRHYDTITIPDDVLDALTALPDEE